MRYVITDKRALSPTTMQLTLQPATDEHLTWKPGQYVAVSFKRYGRHSPARCFSITNQPNADGTLQLAMRVSGRFTSSLADQPLHSACDVQGAFGDFTYGARTSMHSVLIAGGIGITPIYSLATAIANQPDRYCTVLYSVRDQQDVPFADELQQLATNHRNIRLGFVVNNGETDRFPNGQALTGHITPALLKQASNGQIPTTDYFICGPQGFMDGMTAILEEEGADPGAITTEAFNQATRSTEQRSLMRYFTTYTVSVAAFLLIGGAIVRADVTKSNLAATAASTTPVTTTSRPINQPQKEKEEDEEEDDDDRSTAMPAVTTQTTSPTTTTVQQPTATPVMQSYQRPMTTVS